MDYIDIQKNYEATLKKVAHMKVTKYFCDKTEESASEFLEAVEQYLIYAKILNKDKDGLRTKVSNQIDTISNKAYDNTYLFLHLHRLNTRFICPVTNFVRINNKRFAEKWSDIHDAIGIKTPAHRTQLKKFLMEEDLVRTVTIQSHKTGKKVKNFIVNPFKIKKKAHCGMFALSCFSDFLRVPYNIDELAYYYLSLKIPLRFTPSLINNGVLTFSEVEFNNSNLDENFDDGDYLDTEE